MGVTASAVEQLGPRGHRRAVRCLLDWDSSYPTGGEVLTPGDVGLGEIVDMEYFAVVTPDSTASVGSGVFDPATRKLKLNDVDSEVASTADINALVTEHIFVGY